MSGQDKRNLQLGHLWLIDVCLGLTLCVVVLTTIKNLRTVSESNKSDQALTFYMKENDCDQHMTNFTANRGTVVVLDEVGAGYSYKKCLFHIQVEAGFFISARVKIPASEKKEECKQVIVYDSTPLDTEHEIAMFFCRVQNIPFLASSNNNLYFKYANLAADHQRLFGFRVKFVATARSLREVMPIVRTSNSSGHITSPGFDANTGYPRSVDTQQHLHIPRAHVVMISFPFFDADEFMLEPCDFFLELNGLTTDNEQKRIWKKCETEKISPSIQNISRLVIRLHTAKHWVAPDLRNHANVGSGFKMLFTFHPFYNSPQLLTNGLFNCSVDHFSSFREHLACNLEPECENKQDETGQCPYSSQACGGRVASYNKCYFCVSHLSSSWYQAQDVCKKYGGHLATIKTSRELVDVRKMFQFGKKKETYAYVGVINDGKNVPFVYANIWRWVDQSIIYIIHHLEIKLEIQNPVKGSTSGFRCMYYSVKANTLAEQICYESKTKHILCETELVTKHSNVQIVLPSHRDVLLTFHRMHMFAVCHEGHIVHSFQRCEPKSRCGAERHMPRCPLFAHFYRNKVGTDFTKWVYQFTCENDLTIHYTLVCDHQNDCMDNSDEKFCQHPSCDGFRCDNDQCVPHGKRCNQLPDCWDGSDEAACQKQNYRDLETLSKPPSMAVITLDGKGSYTFRTVDVRHPCPGTHYLCPSELILCLPVFTRCNGFHDCVRGEDELGCSNATCPGFYRCRDSTVCVHTDHLCDGWPQCPQHDDEWLCVLTCPPGCLCQGHAFLCYQPFHVYLFSQVRYLDASYSGTLPSHLRLCVYLVYLSLRRCSLTHINEMTIPNLKILDLSENHLKQVNTSMFLGLTQLRVLKLSQNPLKQLLGGLVTNHIDQIKIVDLSNTELTVFDGALLAQFHFVQLVNISYTKIHSVDKGGFRNLPNLSQLDLRGSPIQNFPFNIYQGLYQLTLVYSTNYRLCCRQLFFDQTDKLTCITHQNAVSSCEDLLRLALYQFHVFLISVLAIMGNTICLFSHHVFHEETTEGGFRVLISNLNIAKLFMGIYSGIIGTGDVLFRGRYMHHEQTWKRSISCRVSGFLYLFSCEVSSLVLFLITVDRFVNLRFPTRGACFGQKSAVMAIVVTWALGFLLAVFPLLPSTSHWQLYNGTGICNPSLATTLNTSGRTYSFVVFIVLNFVLFLLIFSAQCYIHVLLTRQTLVVLDDKSSCEMLLSRRLISAGVADCVCWFVYIIFCLATLFTNSPTNEFNVIASLVVIPASSTISPLLYLQRMWQERKHKEKEAELLTLLKRRIAQQK